MEKVQKMQYLWLLFLLPIFGFSQTESQDTTSLDNVDLRYREDQIYLGITYNVLLNSPSNMTSRGLSGGVQGGIMRDMPINERRNLAFALGVGVAYDQFGHNLFIGEDNDGNSIFRVLDGDVNFTQNRFGMAMIEVPVEFRWRTSTPSEYKFWRIYAGARIGYAYWYKATFKQVGNDVNQTKIPEFDPVRISATLSFGFNTFNFFASYSVNPFFKEAYSVDEKRIDLKTLKVGLMFYVL